MSEYGTADRALDEEWMAGVRLVTSTPALRGEYLKVQAMTQYSLAEAIAVRLGANPAGQHVPPDPGRRGDRRHPGRDGPLAALRPAGAAGPAGPAGAAPARRRHAPGAAASASGG